MLLCVAHIQARFEEKKNPLQCYILVLLMKVNLLFSKRFCFGLFFFLNNFRALKKKLLKNLTQHLWLAISAVLCLVLFQSIAILACSLTEKLKQALSLAILK